MFKKTLLALSVATLATAANAGTLALSGSTGTGTTAASGAVTCDGGAPGGAEAICVASETAVIGEAGQTTPVAFDLHSGANYHNADASAALITYDPQSTIPVGARITFTLTNGFFADSNYDLVTAADASVVVASLANEIKDADGNVTAIELTVGTALAGGTSYVLSNGAGAAAAAAVGNAIDTISLEFANGTAAGDQVELAASARDNLGNLSSAAATKIPVIAFSKQFAKATANDTKNAVVDVAMSRKDFDTTDGSHTATGDLNTAINTAVDLTDDVANLDVAIALAGVTVAHTLTDTDGFAGINHSTTVTTGLTNTAKSTVDGDPVVVSTTDTNMASITGNTGDLDYDVTLEINNDDAQPARTISMSTELDYTAAATAFGKETFNFGSVTTFTLNGANFEVPYVPFGDNTQVIFRVTNTSAQTGDISVRYLEEGAQDSWKDLGVIGSVTPGITNVADMVIDAIKADSGLTKGKVALDVTVNAPDGKVTGYVAYKVVSETDRGFVGTFQ